MVHGRIETTPDEQLEALCKARDYYTALAEKLHDDEAEADADEKLARERDARRIAHAYEKSITNSVVRMSSLRDTARRGMRPLGAKTWLLILAAISVVEGILLVAYFRPDLFHVRLAVPEKIAANADRPVVSPPVILQPVTPPAAEIPKPAAPAAPLPIAAAPKPVAPQTPRIAAAPKPTVQQKPPPVATIPKPATPQKPPQVAAIPKPAAQQKPPPVAAKLAEPQTRPPVALAPKPTTAPQTPPPQLAATPQPVIPPPQQLAATPQPEAQPPAAQPSAAAAGAPPQTPPPVAAASAPPSAPAAATANSVPVPLPTPIHLEPVAGTHSLPPYPINAKRLGQAGTTLLRLGISVEGTVSECNVTKGSGSAQLDAVACTYVQGHWRWKPPMRDGQPATAATNVTIVWNLQTAR